MEIISPEGLRFHSDALKDEVLNVYRKGVPHGLTDEGSYAYQNEGFHVFLKKSG